MKKNIKTNDAVFYNGEVYIQYKYGKKTKQIKKHNEGKIALFTAITQALGGRFDDAKKYMPKYLMGVDATGDPESPCFYYKAAVQDIMYFNDSAISSGSENNIIRYVFVVPVSSLIPDKQITQLQLKNESEDICATLDLEGTDRIDTDVAASLLIYWDLKFMNPVSE
ncbi:MAG: hypothetical protein M0Q88_00430 [Bacilli bacterium]|nr:hypothetical protein [Bacilli bacterium]